jgi:hypothetical protein
VTLLLPETAHEAVVEVNQGLWIAKCPRPFCSNAEHAGPHPLSQHVGGLREPQEPGSVMGTFRCNICTWEGPARWPARDERAAIERLLAMRPVPMTRNWAPPEEVRDLVAENVQYGVLDVRATEQNGGR